MNLYQYDSKCSFAAGGESIMIEQAASGCTQNVLSTFQFIKLSGNAVEEVKFNCSNAKCNDCTHVSTKAVQLGECMTLEHATKPFEAKFSALLYTAHGASGSKQPCYGPLEKASAEDTPANALYVVTYEVSHTCSGVPAIARRYDNVTSTKNCVFQQGSDAFHQLTRNGSHIEGGVECNSTACDTCAMSINASLTQCTNTSGQRSYEVRQLRDIESCSPPPSGPPQGSGNTHGQAWTAMVIGSTLGAAAVVWLLLSAVFCRGKKSVQYGSLQAGEGDGVRRVHTYGTLEA